MTLAEILKRVCLAYGVPKGEFMSGSLCRNTTQARAAFCYWARIMTGRSFPVIARHIGLDHSTVIYHYQTYLRKASRYADTNAIKCMLAVNA